MNTVFIRTILSHIRLKARRLGICDGKPGAVVFLQRWGSALNLNPHFHALVPDGVYSESASGRPRFHLVSPPTDEEVAKLTCKVHDRVYRLLCASGFFHEESIQDGDPLPFDSDGLGRCYAASIQGRVGLGERQGAYVTREGRRKDARFMEMTGERCAAFNGFTLHGNVWIHGRRRRRLERLYRYVARPAIAPSRLSLLSDGRVRYRLRREFNDGTRAVIFDPLTFVEKLAALVPPPRLNRVPYHGVFAPNARLRVWILPRPDSSLLLPGLCKKRKRIPDPDYDTPERRRRRYTWAELLKRVFRLDALKCPHCKGGRRKLIAMITEYPVIRTILECLNLPC